MYVYYMAILNEEKIEKGNVVIENLLHNSTNILKTSYNYNTNQLVTTFKNGGVYTYDAVSEEVYREFKEAPSSGSYLNGTIRKNHKVNKKGELNQSLKNELLIKIETLKGSV